MPIIIADSNPPVLVERSTLSTTDTAGHQVGYPVELRLGEIARGETRYVMLTSRQARVLAYALLDAAERGSSN